ncbi:esterase/lipase family protein [Caenimonas terrae]|uniref:Esterase/lipase family protein n=1 Tax=Caenimonas terrae TaxID=696074 RepID=A0ABW0NIL3_9BURK
MKRASSSLARILQCATLLLLAGAIAWLAWYRNRSPWLAGAGFAAIAAAYSGALAFEFLALRRVNRSDPVPQAGWATLARAWLAETLQAPRVFGWRQPFRWNAVADHLPAVPESGGRRGIVFVHGFICNRGFWTPWLRQVRRRGHPFAAVNLEPVFGSIDDYVAIIERAVTAVTLSSGLPPILVCHSMGGLAARAWLRAGPHARRVHRVVTIGTPHQGTWLARSSRSKNGRQMAQGSTWLRQLEADSASLPQPPFTCWYSNCDNVVFPSSTATLSGAQNLLVVGAAHVDLAFHPRVMAQTMALLDRL